MKIDIKAIDLHDGFIQFKNDMFKKQTNSIKENGIK